MVLDMSAVVAVLIGDPEAERIVRAIAGAERRRMSAVNWLEAALAVDGLEDPVVSRDFDLFIRRAEVEIEPVTAEQAAAARLAFRDFGRGHHAAGLDFGDCLAYALAKSVDEPLLFQGVEFGRTDVKVG